jgi:uncharacterized protein (TIGR02145 family)
MGPWVHNKENKMKKRLLAISLAAGFTALMTACDETTNTDIMNADAAATVDSLPKCDKSYDGMLATIPSKGEILICTQGEWENVAKTIGSSTPGSNDGSTAGCTAKTLSDGDGVQIICDGKKVATLKNGEKGEQGETGSAGSPGTKGGNGSPGSNGSSGKDFKLSADDCVIHRMVGDLVIYNCGDSTYQEALSTANVKTWNALDFKTAFTNKSGSSIGSFETAHLPSASANPGEGKLERWDGDTWAGSEAVTADELMKNFAIKGKATLTVEKGAKAFNGVLEPSVGVDLSFTTNPDIYSWGGVCVTYTSEKPMELILANGSLEVARATLGVAATETTVNIAANQFKADSQDVKLEDILKSPKDLFIKAVGSLEEGEYENEFAIYELGAYKHCSGNTVEDVETWAAGVKKGTGTLVDDRTTPAITYNTVTIGNQTWMAENLRLPYPSKTDDGDGDPETDEGAPMIYCPATEEDLVAKGCLYRWSAAMDSVGLYNEASVYQDDEGNDVALKHCGYNKSCALEAPVKGICPDGWHLPSKNEIETLKKTVNFDDKYPSIASLSVLKEFANWSGFSMVRTGYTLDYSTLTAEHASYAWSSEQYSNSIPWLLLVDPNNLSSNLRLLNSFTAQYGMSVRCIQDQANE